MLNSRVKSINDTDELQLVANVAKGDHVAYRQLFEQHAARVYNVALKILGNEQDAEEVTQDVFVTLWKKAKSIRGESKLSTWLHRVAVNMAINARKKGGMLSTLKQILSLEDSPELEISAAESTRPDRQVEMKSARMELAELMSRLPTSQRQAYLLHKLEGLSYKEIAEQMNTTVSAVESLMHRAKTKLQKVMIQQHRKGARK
jgi:RNA polymerase sigma-70 factor (ECF subfamily)